METEIIGLCARCLKSHAGKCAKVGLALYIAAGPVYQSMHDGVPHDRLRPWITATGSTASGSSLSATFAFSMPNTMFPGPNFEAPAPYVWQIVARTPGAERPVPQEQKAVWWVEPKKPDKA